MRHNLILALLALLPSACSISEKPRDWQQLRQNQFSYIQQNHLLQEQNGWQIWQVVRKRKPYCMAIKPATGRSWPEFSKETTPVSGGAGFYMDLDAEHAYLGFYGAHGYGRISRAWLDNEIVLDTNNPDTVLSWEGKTLDFEVESQPSAGIYRNPLTVTGQLDFTGVTAAYDAVKQCQQAL